MSSSPEIRRGQSADLPAVLRLLEEAGLPTADLAQIPHLDLWVLEADNSSLMVGAIALERFGSEGLLRSLVVAPDYRNRSFGSDLVARLERDARADGVKQLVLLTETAKAFFATLGYQVTDRSRVSEALKQSAEFRTLCPASALCMSKLLP